MKYLKNVVLGTFLILFGAARLFAGNPADLTESYRFCPVEFYKLTYDGGPRWALAVIPLSKDLSLSVFHWQNEESTSRSWNLTISKSFSPYFEAALNTILDWDSDTTTAKEEIAFDLHNKICGLGIVIPFQPGENVKIGPRININNLSTYFTFSNDEKPFVGVSWSKKSVCRVDGAYSLENKTSYARISKSFETRWGSVIPEFRLKFTQSEEFYGIGIGFIPK